jgi:ATP-dependent protease ClpP protease subunit
MVITTIHQPRSAIWGLFKKASKQAKASDRSNQTMIEKQGAPQRNE